MLVVLRPSGRGTFTLAGLAILATALTYALSAIAVRVLGRTDSTQSMVFWLMVMVAVGAGCSRSGWRPIQPAHWLPIAAMALTGSLAQWGLTEAFRLGQASFIAPLEYTALVWGVILDWALWRTLPGPLTFGGAAVIIASGVYLLRFERSTWRRSTSESISTGRGTQRHDHRGVVAGTHLREHHAASARSARPFDAST